MGHQSSSSNAIDGKTGSSNISEHFKGIYSDLYNMHKDGEKVHAIKSRINDNIKQCDISEINKINPAFIMSIINKMKKGKNDVNFDWRTDALIHGCDISAPYLSDLLKMYFVHGHVTDLFLKCALVPIVKDKNSSSSSSDNYRAIAISSIIMKLVDSVFLELQPSAFLTSNYQFGFQSGSSTTLCSWAVLGDSPLLY